METGKRSRYMVRDGEKEKDDGGKGGKAQGGRKRDNVEDGEKETNEGNERRLGKGIGGRVYHGRRERQKERRKKRGKWELVKMRNHRVKNGEKTNRDRETQTARPAENRQTEAICSSLIKGTCDIIKSESERGKRRVKNNVVLMREQGEKEFVI